MLVETITGPDGTLLLGHSPVPGPSAAPMNTGVLVSLSGAELDRTIAHEMGHYLGLWHTYEASISSIKDPLPDTPLAGTRNLMSPTPTDTELSPEQAVVLLAHPLVYHECERSNPRR